MTTMKKVSNPYIKRCQSDIQGHGIFATSFIPKGSQIVEYVGERVTPSQSEKILERLDETDSHIYIFSLNDRWDIDGDTEYNIAKYINHSCEPNCFSYSDEKNIWIVAKRDIQVGEELFYDYGFDRPGWENHRCLCHSAHCFGFIVARSHWASIRKTKRYQQLKSKINR